MSDDPFVKLRALQARVADLVDSLGMDLAGIEFVPHDEYGNMVHLIVQVRPETLKTNEEVEQDSVRSEFESLMGGFEIVEGEDGDVSLVDHEARGPEDEFEKLVETVLDEAEAKMRERARERARRLLSGSDDE
jgi:hypothetical protein